MVNPQSVCKLVQHLYSIETRILRLALQTLGKNCFHRPFFHIALSLIWYISYLNAALSLECIGIHIRMSAHHPSLRLPSSIARYAYHLSMLIMEYYYTPIHISPRIPKDTWYELLF